MIQYKIINLKTGQVLDIVNQIDYMYKIYEQIYPMPDQENANCILFNGVLYNLIGKPPIIPDMDTLAIQEYNGPTLENINAKLDYISMMQNIELFDDENHTDKVKEYYASKLWNFGMLRGAIGKWITQEEFNEIIENE